MRTRTAGRVELLAAALCVAFAEQCWIFPHLLLPFETPSSEAVPLNQAYCRNRACSGRTIHELILSGEAEVVNLLASPGGREGHERCSRGMTAGLPSQTVSTSVHTTLCTSGWCVRACVSTEQRVCLSRGAAALSPGYRLSLTKETPFIRFLE
uniref:Uncharacterized protein n=1 Tax=Sphaerodactylus townsendi TaxID=933632 RepID=A0ACB8G0H9_9SAUR